MTAIDTCDVKTMIDLEKIKKCILQTSIVAWNQLITLTSLDRWLNNFTGEALGDAKLEQTIAAWLLMNFTYYSQTEVHELCRIIFRKYIHAKLQQEQYKKLSNSTDEKIREIIRHTRFVNLGNPSESGALVLFNFRTANNLPKNLFELPSAIEGPHGDTAIEDIVMIDDVTISGSQAIDYLKGIPKNGVNTTLLTFFATPEAMERLQRDAPGIIPLHAVLLDERSHLFDSDSFVFSNTSCNELRDDALKLCLHYGRKIVNNELPQTEAYMKRYPLGFGDGQQMFAFYYNTPDNTLPIFWCESSNWSAVFRRFSKIYNSEGVLIPDGQYW